MSDACRQGDVSDDGRICRVRARHDSGTRPRRACEGQERGEASWSASDSPCAGETNPKFANDDGSAHPGHATDKDKYISVQPSADPKIGDIAKEHPEHPAHPHSDVTQLASFKFADEGSADSGHLAHPHFDNAKVPGTVMSTQHRTNSSSRKAMTRSRT